METKKCRDKNCGREMPGDYKYRYCENCRNKHLSWVKGGMKAVGVVGSFALMILTKGKIGPKD